jgi:cytochrome c peroxidase
MARNAAIGALAASMMLAGLWGCGSDATAPQPGAGTTTSEGAAPADSLADLVAEVRRLTEGRGIGPMPRTPRVRQELIHLGKMLSFDRVLSGNRDISCMTCHLPALATGDGRSLSVGQGAVGEGLARLHPDGRFIPRNAPALFNLSTTQSLFWDGRVSHDGAGGYTTPAGLHLTPEMTRVFEFGAISALALFPVLSREEMRGDAGAGNELAAVPDDDPAAVWRALMARLGAIPEYRALFEAAYPGQRFDDMTFAHASNAVAGFLVGALSFNRSPWDRFLAGDDGALTPTQLAGAKNFMSARCSICHNGAALSDDAFHNVAVAQIGPGQGDGAGGHDDFGRMRVTGDPAERYAFRTPALRNVELTAPYGHDGAIVDLREFIAHYSESDLKLRSYDSRQLEPSLQGTVVANFAEILATRDTLLNGVVFPDQVIDEVTEFMRALTDPAARGLARFNPVRVPSGLPVD